MSAGKFILAGCAWGVVFGVMNGISNAVLLPSAPFISIRPQIALPMAMGIISHPIAGFLVGFSGNVIGDGLSGFGLWKFWNWHIANGLIGFLPGMIIRCFGIGRITTVRDFGILEMGVILGSGVSVGVAVLLDYFFLHFMKFPESFTSWILPAFLTDVVNGFILVPVLLIMTRRLILTLETRTILLITTLLVLAVISTAGSITWSVWYDLVSTDAMIESFYIAGIVSVLFIVFGFVASIAFVRRITDPVSRLTRAAEDVEKGIYDLGALNPVSLRNDELGQLSRGLQMMANQIRKRENHLLLQVKELQIKIDLDRKERDVAEIVETEYFQALKKKAKEFRKS
ncbi:MAG: HAMP domain-containing protein [Deltaproteobacteria bacterium]|nr:HAMP domain-containing protein [Deltaproteobacteria bacterium]